MADTVTETCACGASFTITAGTYVALKHSLDQWRNGHRHDVPAADRITTHADEVVAVVPPTPRRLAECVTRWPEAETGDYDPRCCRFPKSCSADVYDDDKVTDAALEAAR